MDREELACRFTYHPPSGDQPHQYEEIRGRGSEFTALLIEYCEDCRELSLAITKIEEAVMWANAAIARRGV